MRVTDVAEELAARLRRIPDLTVFAHPVASVVPPAAIVVWPDQITYDATYQRGMDTLTFPVVLVVGQTSDGRAAMDALSRYWDGSGPWSVKAALETGGPVDGVLDDVQVGAARAGEVSIGGVSLLAAEFTTEVAGEGTT